MLATALFFACTGQVPDSDTTTAREPDPHQAAAERVVEVMAALVILADIVAVDEVAESEPPACPAVEVSEHTTDGSGCIDCGTRTRTVRLDWSVPACPGPDRPWLGSIAGDGTLTREWSVWTDGDLWVDADLSLAVVLSVEATRLDSQTTDPADVVHVGAVTLGERVLAFDVTLEQRRLRTVASGTIDIGDTEVELVELGVDPTQRCFAPDQGEAIVRWRGSEARVEGADHGLVVDIVPAQRTVDPCSLPPWFVVPGAAPPTPMPPAE